MLKLKLACTFLISLIVHLALGQNHSAKDVAFDFEFLYKSLQETHYNLFVFREKKDYDNFYYSKQNEIKGDSVSMLQTVSLFQSLVSYANTGHCEIDFPAQSYIKYAYAGGTVFPLELAFEGDKAYIRKNLSTNDALIVGHEIISIDKKPIAEILKMLYPHVSSEREYSKKAKIEFWSFPRLFYQAFSTKEEWTIQIRSSNKEVSEMVAKAITVIDYETKRKGELVNPQRTFKYFGKTAYLNPGGFGSSEPNGESQFKQFIDSTFSDMKIRGSQNLIIDLRNNPGGHNAYSDYLIGYFATKPFKWYAQFSLKTSRILKKQTRLQSDTTDNYSRAILSHADGTIFKYEFESHNQVEPLKRFQGNIYVLINRQTYSMAAVTAALIQDYKFGKIVGEETGDTPSLYASQFSYQLPKTGITVKVPKGYIVRPNGDKKLKGVEPDIEVQDHLLDDNDEILRTLLNVINDG